MKKLYISLILVLSLLLMSCGSQSSSYKLDKNAQDGTLKPVAEQIKDQLQEQADKSNFSIQIYGEPEFQNGTSEGYVYISNPETNVYSMSVRIFLDDTGEDIYQSNILKPGESVEKIKLTSNLAKGEYAATAVFTAIDDDNTEIGQVAAGLTVIILE